MMDYLKRITHCTFTCKNYAAMVDFYENVLGLEKVFSLDFNEPILNAYKSGGYYEAAPLKPGDEWITYFRVAPREFIELFNLPYNGENEIQNEGFHHICLLVEDISEAAKELEKKGITLYKDPVWKNKPYTTPYPETPQKDATGSYSFYIQDPEKNQIQIMQYTADSKQVTTSM